MDGEIIQQPKVAMGYDLTKFYGIDEKGIPFFYHLNTSNISSYRRQPIKIIRY